MQTLRQLEHVLALLEHRHFGRAAEAAGVTQSALTQSIQKLEQDYGVRLFERGRREVSPTQFGVLVADTARQTLLQLSHVKREIGLMRNLESGHLIVGSDPLISEALLGPALGRMVNRYPDLRFSVRSGRWDELQGDLIASRIDLYVGSPLAAPDRRLDQIALELPPLVIACNPAHPLLHKAVVRAEDCLAYPIASPKLPSWYYTWLARQIGDPVARDGGNVYSYFLEADDYGIIRWLVRHTNTLTGILPTLIAEDVARGAIRTLNLETLNFPLPAVVASLAGRALPPAAEVLIAEIVDRERVELTSLTLPGVTRVYRGFSKPAEENGLSRLYAGIHFRHAARDGRRQGRGIGQALAEALPRVR